MTPLPLKAIPGKMGINWPADPKQSQRLCGAYYTCNVGTYCGSPQEYGMSLDSENITDMAILDYGFLNFDNLGVGII